LPVFPETETRMRQLRSKVRRENIFVWRDSFYHSIQLIRELSPADLPQR
jgi:hypothetical protein